MTTSADQVRNESPFIRYVLAGYVRCSKDAKKVMSKESTGRSRWNHPTLSISTFLLIMSRTKGGGVMCQS